MYTLTRAGGAGAPAGAPRTASLDGSEPPELERVSATSRWIVIGTASNYLGKLLTLVTWFFLTPFILRQLGPSRFGLWVLTASVVSYGSLLDFGLTSAIVKFVAARHVPAERDETRGLIATALRLSVLLGLAVAALSAAFAPAFPSVFNVAAQDQATARWLVVLAGCAMALSLPNSAASAVLQGLLRYDLANLVTVGGTLSTAVASVVVLLLGGGVLGMVAATLPISVLTTGLALWLARRVDPRLGLGLTGARLNFVKPLLGFSSSVVVLRIAGYLQARTDEIIVGAFMPVGAVTPYALAHRLSELPPSLSDQFLRVLLPLASQLHARDEQARLRALYVTGTRLTLAISSLAGGLLVLLAGPILGAWADPSYAAYADLLVVLTLASIVDASLWPANFVLQGMARHRPLAAMSLASGLANLGLSLVLVRQLGLMGVALGTLIPTCIEATALVLPYSMRVLGIRPWAGIADMFVPALVPLVPMALVVLALRHAFEPASLPALALVASSGCFVYATVYALVGAGSFERQTMRRALESAGILRSRC